VAAGITDHQREFDHDLIIMCSHGRSDANKLVFGSIAQKIASLGTVPVLIVRAAAHGLERSAFSATPMLVPIDTTGKHEASLAIAEHLAAQVGGQVQLVMVVPTLGTIPGQWEDATKLLPHSTDRMLEMAAEEAAAFLEEKRAILEGRGIAVTAELDRGDPARVICEHAQRGATQLVVLGTHGKSGMEAIWEGSVANRVISRVAIPVLLIPIAD
jgi:nucleotide-binding universal stress UspA family protein